MSIDPAELDVVYYPDAILRQKAAPIPEITDEVRAVAARMIELMHEHDGIGLAAPQVGLPWRMFVTRGEDGEPETVFINPVLSLARGDLVPHEEGCLSLPGITVDVRRPKAASITAMDLDGNSFTLETDAFTARIWQHEFDHLDGRLIIDRMGPMDRLATRKQLRELEHAARR
ncbi:MAG: peptide deformylase [Planctomycetota bacterium]